MSLIGIAVYDVPERIAMGWESVVRRDYVCANISWFYKHPAAAHCNTCMGARVCNVEGHRNQGVPFVV